MKKALLLGNGLNRLFKNYSWEDLIKDLIRELALPNPPATKGKPFPLLYEEIVQASFQIGIEETAVKETLASLVHKIKASSLHSRIAALGVADILTTNYDYNVEESWPGQEPSDVDVTESKYSLFRRRSYPGVDIWFIHGERDRPDSILLGYNHYADYLETMRGYMFKGIKAAASRDVDALRDRIRNKKLGDQGASWLDFFFNRDLYIVGLGLDYTEIHLWWLITYRARLRSKSDYKFDNEVTYVYPTFIASEIQSRLQLLLGNGIRLHQIKVSRNAWPKFYSEALELVRRAN